MILDPNLEISKIINWSVTGKRFVAFLDILGFRDLVMRKNHAEIYKILQEISKFRTYIDNIGNSDKTPEKFRSTGIHSVSFSDSIVIFSKDDTSESFELFSQTTGWFFAKAIERKIPIKGAMAYGEISLNRSKHIYFGQPVIDAFLLEEELNYMGIVAHHTIDDYLFSIAQDDNVKKRYKYISTPLKCGHITHLNLNWFRHLTGFNDTLDQNSFLKMKVKEFFKQVSGSPRRYIDNSINIIDEIYPKLE